MEWVDSNLGSKTTMKYPSCYLMEPRRAWRDPFNGICRTEDRHRIPAARCCIWRPALRQQDHLKIDQQGWGRVIIPRAAVCQEWICEFEAQTSVCDATRLSLIQNHDLILIQRLKVQEDQVSIAHEASVSKVSDEQLFYLKSRGLSDEEATTMVVSGFIEPLVKELPMEYAVEMNRLIQLQMEGSVG